MSHFSSASVRMCMLAYTYACAGARQALAQPPQALLQQQRQQGAEMTCVQRGSRCMYVLGWMDRLPMCGCPSCRQRDGMAVGRRGAHTHTHARSIHGHRQTGRWPWRRPCTLAGRHGLNVHACMVEGMKGKAPPSNRCVVGGAIRAARGPQKPPAGRPGRFSPDGPR